MKINVIEQSKRRLIFELSEVDNTFCNILRKQLQQDKAVSVATYSIRHPLIGTPKFIIETTTTKTPKEALEYAIKALQTQNKEFLTKFKKLK